MQSATRRRLRPAVIVALTALYIVGAYRYGQTRNPQFARTDQNAYLNEIRQLKDTDDSRITERSRMPVYLYLQSLAARKGMSSSDLFPRAKWVNLIVSAVGLLMVYAIAVNMLPRVVADNLLLITAFTVFAFRAAFVYAELLYYVLFFAAFILMLRLFARPSLWTAAVAGIVLAISHLTKASTLPALATFLAVYLGSALLARANVARAAAICFVLAIAYLATLSPYLINSKRAFGHYFYNVNTTLYLWCDSWLEVTSGPKAHGDRRHWPTMPANEVPNFSKYVHDHGLAHIAVMTGIGAYKLLAEAVNSSGFTKYFAIYCAFAIWLIAVDSRALRGWMRQPGNAGALTFLVASFAVYFLAISFYIKITQPGMRFMLAMFLPTMSGISYLISRESFASTAVQLGKCRFGPDEFHRVVRWMIITNIVISIVPRLLFPHDSAKKTATPSSVAAIAL